MADNIQDADVLYENTSFLLPVQLQKKKSHPWGNMRGVSEAAAGNLQHSFFVKSLQEKWKGSYCAFARKVNSVSCVTVLEASKKAWDLFCQHGCSHVGEQILYQQGRGEKLQ